MTGSLWKDLQLLKRHFSGAGVIVLFMPDGSEVHLTGDPAKFMYQAYDEWHAGTLSKTTQLIARSVNSDEPGGSHLLDLVRCLLNSPAPKAPETVQPEVEPTPEPVKEVNLAPVLVMPAPEAETEIQ